MRLIIALILLFPAIAWAQELTFDTTYLTQVAGTYYVVERMEFDNGEYTEKSRVLGDSSATAQFLVNTSVNEQQTVAAAAMTVIRRNEVNARYNLLDLLFKSLASGLDLYKHTNRQFFEQYYSGAWVIRYNAVDTPVTAELQANGNIRFVDASNNTWQVRAYSPYNFQLRNWEGLNWNLYSENQKRYLDLTKALVIKKQ